MKKVEAVIPHARMERAFAALKELPLGLTYYESKGRGQVPTPVVHSGRGTSVFRPEFNVNITISVVVQDGLVGNVVDKIVDTTSTGLAGEGKIFVTDVDDAVDIGSGSRGDSAI
jgi:nitrogen regulatory protein P-II 1